MFTSVEEAAEKLAEIRRRGYIATQRRSPTGVGHTLKVELGLSENYFTVPILGEVEVQATRGSSNSLITLFTRDRGAWQVPQRTVISEYGISEDDRLNLHVTLDGSDQHQGLNVNVSESSVLLCSDVDLILASWDLDDLLTQFRQKVRHLIRVNARSRVLNRTEHFLYESAVFHSGWMLRWHIPRLFESGILKLDLKMHLRNNSVRNHGTGFCVAESDIDQFYPYGEELPIAEL